MRARLQCGATLSPPTALQEDILGGGEMAGQAQDLMHGMRAAEAAQRASRHPVLPRGGGGGSAHAGASAPGGGPKHHAGGGLQGSRGVGAQQPTSAPEFGGFYSADRT